MNKFIAVIREMFSYLMGYRKCGAYDSYDERDYPLSENLIDYKSRPFEDDGIDLDNIPYQDQGITDRCVGFSWAGAASSLCTRHFGKKTTFNGNYIWHLIELWGYSLPEGGAYLRSGGKAILKECKERGGILATDGRRYSFEKFEEVRPAQFSVVHKKGHQIVTGDIIRTPMCNYDWTIREDGSTRGGHAFIDMDNTGGVDVGRNSWRRWGIRKHGVPTGNFYIPKSYRQKLFRSFILVGPKRIK